MHNHASSHRSTNHISTGLVLKYTSTRVRLDTVSTDTTCYSCIQSVSMPACTQPYLGYNCIRAYQVPTYLDPRSPRHGSITAARRYLVETTYCIIVYCLSVCLYEYELHLATKQFSFFEILVGLQITFYI